MQTLMQFRPVSDTEWWFLGVTLACTVLAFRFLPRVYQRGPAVAVGVALLISWIPVQLTAYVAEGRRMWLPGQHSAIFFWGDSVMLTSVAFAFAAMRRLWVAGQVGVDQAPLTDRWWWRTAVAAVALGVSYWFHVVQIETWPVDRLHALSKVWHDFFVYPIFIYYLGSQLPLVWQVPWRRFKVRQPALVGLALLGFAGWLWLGRVYDPSQVQAQRPLLGFALEAGNRQPVPLAAGPVPWAG